jgi:NAD(P) transhydrogenase subunit beta
MTAMPEMVALLNAFGGRVSALVAGAVLIWTEPTTQSIVATVASGIIGSATFTGSFVAFAKLRGLLLPDAPVTFPCQ